MSSFMTIGRRIAAGYLIATLAAVIVGLIAYANLNKLTETAQWVDHTHQVINGLQDIALDLVDAETGQRGYLITAERSYLQPYELALEDSERHIDRVAGLTTDNPAQQQRIEELRGLIDTKSEEMARTIELRDTSGYEAAVEVVATDAGKMVMDEIRALLAEMEREEMALLAQREEEARRASQLAMTMIVVVTCVGAMLMVVFGVFITRSVSQTISASVQSLGGVTAELTSNTTEQAAGAAQTLTAVTETFVTLDELRQTSEMAVEKARVVAEVGERSLSASTKALNSVSDAIEAIGRIRGEVESIAGNILALSEKNLQISEIVRSVNLIAEQSNLLAVNAAIEAADAGDYGRRFSVVADEVKSLAEQSKQSTDQIRAILGEIQKSSNAAVMVTEQGTKRVAEGVELIERLGQVIEELNQAIDQTTDAGRQISAASSQQAAGLDQITVAMRNVETASRQTVDSSRAIEASTTRVTEVSDKLLVLVGSGTGGPA